MPVRKSITGTETEETPASAKGIKRHMRDNPWLRALVIVILAFLAYQPVWHAGFIWDDDAIVANNQLLRNADGLRKIWMQVGATTQYYPLVFSSLWVEHRLWGLQPLGYHLVNVLLHALNGVLLWRVLRQLELPGAWWAAAIFMIHPVQVESVAWIAERKNVLSGLFYFLALLAYLRFQPLRRAGEVGPRDWRFYPLVLILFLCALLSKTVTCSLPAVIVLLVWWKTGRLEKREILPVMPLFAIGAALGLMTVSMEKQYVGARGAEWTLSFFQRCLLAGRALWFYAGKLFWPRHLTFIYPRWEIDAGVWWQYLFPLGALAVLWGLWLLRRRAGSGPLVAMLCFAGTLLPALGFFDVYPFRYSFVADHFQYLACIGLISLAVSTGAAICERAGHWGRDLGTLAAAIVLLLLGVSTWRQARIYQDVETLWRDTIAKNPGCWLAHNNLGLILSQSGKIQNAIQQYEQALQIKPNLTETHNNLGIALCQLGKTQEAIQHYEHALGIEPDFAGAHNNLGLALLQLGRLPEAKQHCEEALRIAPDFVEAHYNLGNVLLRLGDMSGAIDHYQQALRGKPDYVEAHNNLGVALFQLDRLPEAKQQFEETLRIKPDYADARSNLLALQSSP